MFNILENRMKTDLNLSNYSDLKGPRPLDSLIYRLRVNALKTKYYKDVACTHREKLSTNRILLNCLQLKKYFLETQTYFRSTEDRSDHRDGEADLYTTTEPEKRHK